MEMLKSLGIDSTIIIQFFVFLAGYVVLTRLVFKPYFKAYLERYNRTTGSEDLASQIDSETELLEKEFEENAKAINFKIKKIFDDEKKVALQKQDGLVKDAYLKATELRNKSKLKLDENKKSIMDQLEKEVEPLSELIKQKVLG